MTAPVLTLEKTSIDFWVDGNWIPAAKNVDLTLEAGEVVAIVGESGSGKSTTAMGILGLLPKNSRVRGSINLQGTQLVGASDRVLRKVRGNEAAVIFQEPMTALNPVYTVGYQITEAVRSHTRVLPADAKKRALELMRLVDIPEPERRFHSFPHQLSGGQRQRIMIAQALACDPAILIADEPTTALDVTVQAEILDLLRDLKDRINASIILISHDMGAVADLADRIFVMNKGDVVESGAAREVFNNPQHPYTQQLLAAVPHLGSAHATPSTEEEPATDKSREPILTMRNAVIEYKGRKRADTFRAVKGVDLTISSGEVLGLVGESGSGKSTIGRAIVGLVPVASGEVSVVGHDLTTPSRAMRLTLSTDVSMVFQDPGSSLNPRMPIGESIGEPLKLHKIASGKELSTKVEELLDSVELSHTLRNRYPHELSGGQRQRVGIARALALRPKLLIADEPTSALDVSVQDRVLKLFQQLQKQFGFACLFISHDLAVVEMLASRIAVMRHGEIIEAGARHDILTNPQHAYTQQLIAAVPVPDPDEQYRRREARRALLQR